MKTIHVNCSNKIGPIKDMHCVGGGPMQANFAISAMEEFREAGFPYARTHDIEYPFGAGEYVDIHCIFPNFSADVDDPASYNFALTDLYFKCALEVGTRIFYRLGSTIEHQPVKRYIYPPADYHKWAEICSHIVDHYNNGWADGHHMNIEYWEIWNEPDLKNKCWIGSDESYFELYEVASKYLKAQHPEIKVGGCAVTAPTTEYTDKFLQYVKKTGSPLDFFSYHGYIHTPEGARDNANVASAKLDKYGFTGVEEIYDEWNYVVDWNTVGDSLQLKKTAFAASFVAGVLSALQDTRLSKSMYYDVQCFVNEWNGVFTPVYPEVHGEAAKVTCEPPFYALKAWNDLKKLGTQVETKVSEDLYVTAAASEDKLALLISYYNDDATLNQCPPADDVIALDLGTAAYTSCRAFVTDRDQTNTEIPFDGTNLPMKGNSIAYVEYTLK